MFFLTNHFYTDTDGYNQFCKQTTMIQSSKKYTPPTTSLRCNVYCVHLTHVKWFLLFRFSPIDLAAAGARRKNATRETTSTLKAWLYEHRKNPYPTKGEKIMLAIITKMTLTQVSTWFANARRRLKKENKMTWSPRNRCGEKKDGVDDDDAASDSDCEEQNCEDNKFCDNKDEKLNAIKGTTA